MPGAMDDAYLDGALLGTLSDYCLEYCVGQSYGNVGIFRIWRKGASRYRYCISGKDGFSLEKEKQEALGIM